MWWHVPLTIVWLVGCANAVNLIDGLDGVAAGIGICACGAALVSALLGGNSAVPLVAAPLLGALLGFLIYNFSPASIFMGDCGSNTVGFLLGCITILWAPIVSSPGAMLACHRAGRPILDTALAIVRRFVRRDPIFAADRGHIHHRLLSRGFSPRRAAWILYCAGRSSAAWRFCSPPALTVGDRCWRASGLRSGWRCGICGMWNSIRWDTSSSEALYAR